MNDKGLTRSAILGLAGLLGLAAVATLARVCLFFAQFDDSWPAQFCYGPEGAFMFESVAGLPILAAGAACASALAFSRAHASASLAVACVTCGLGGFLLLRVWKLVGELSAHQYDERCTTIAAWAYQYPLLSVATRPISAAALVGVVTIAIGAVMYTAVKTKVA